MLILTIEQKTWAHPIHVGVKLVALFGLTFVVFPIVDIGVLGLFLCGLFVLYASLGRRGLSAGLWAMRPVLLFAAMILSYHMIIGQLLVGGVIVAKMFVLLAAANFVTMTSRLSDMMELVIKVLGPLRIVGVKPEWIGLAFALVIRFTPVLGQRGSILAEAWRARSGRRPGFRILAPMVISTLDDAEHAAEALRARGGVK